MKFITSTIIFLNIFFSSKAFGENTCDSFLTKSQNQDWLLSPDLNAIQLHYQQNRSEVNTTNFVITNYDWVKWLFRRVGMMSINYRRVQYLPPSTLKWFKPALEFFLFIKQHPDGSWDRGLDTFTRYRSVLAAMPDNVRRNYFSTLEKQKILFLDSIDIDGDLKLMINNADQMISAKKFDSWVELVLSIHENGDGIANKHPLVLEFYNKFGLMDIPRSFVFTEPMPWVTEKSLRKHFRKRTERGELDIASEQDLIALANQFLLSNTPTQIVFRRTNGTFVKFDPTSEELAIVSEDKKIITYFLLEESYRKGNSLNYFLAHALLGIPFIDLTQ